MIEQQLKNYFKRFTAITPRGEFLARSRAEVTRAIQEPAHYGWSLRFKESLTTSGALALASFLILIILGGVSYVTKQSGNGQVAASFNTDALSREAAQLSFQVQLKDAEYFDESASQVVRALESIANERSIQ